MKKFLIFTLCLLPAAGTLRAQDEPRPAREIRSGGIQIIDGNEERPVSMTKRLTFWTGSTAHGNIKVYVNKRQIGTITRAYSSAPRCGASGCAHCTVDRTPSSWYGVAADGTIYESAPVTFRTGCNTIFLYPTGRRRPSGSGSGGGSHGSGSSAAPSAYGSGSSQNEWARTVGAEVGAAAGNLLGVVLSSGRGWDSDCNRIDMSVGWGVNYGGLGVKVNYQAPVVFGVTAGFGYNLRYKSPPRATTKNFTGMQDCNYGAPIIGISR